VANETVQRLEPLVLTDAATSVPENLGDGALALLVARIVAANHRFRVTPATLSLLCAICVQLDGLPLALEMAAARVPTIGVQRVHDALAQRFTLLTRTHRNVAPHHRTLHDALDWSYRLLPGPEQRLFRALGVFAGGFALDLAVALMTDASHDHDAQWDVIDGVATLADRSLVVVSSDDPPRYRLLETMRAFALEQLALAGEEHATRASHAAAMLALFSSYVGASAAAKTMCEAEMENARDAIAWLREHDLGAAALLTARGRQRRHLHRLAPRGKQLAAGAGTLDEPTAGHALPAQVQAEWWTGLGRVLVIRGETRASVAARRALELWRPLQQPKQSLMAAVAWVRGISSAGPELEQACAELQALAAAVRICPRVSV